MEQVMSFESALKTVLGLVLRSQTEILLREERKKLSQNIESRLLAEAKLLCDSLCSSVKILRNENEITIKLSIKGIKDKGGHP